AGNFGGKKPALLLDEAGLRAVSMDWSARGEISADGIRFDLNLPPATIATLDLYLPPDFIVVRSPDRYTLAGPQPAEPADHRLWHVGFAADVPLHLQVRRLDNGSNSPPVLTMRLKERQQLMPDALEAEYGL